MLPSKIPAIESDIALPTTAPANAPTAPKSYTPIIAGMINNKLSIIPKIISGNIFFRLILKIYAIKIGTKPRPKINRLTYLPILIEKNAIIPIIIERRITIPISNVFFWLFFIIISNFIGLLK
jgi:hypothetical protein